MNNSRFKEEFGKLKGDVASNNNSSHKAFVERLKKQILSVDSSSSDGCTGLKNDDVCSEELMKELESKCDRLFASLDDSE